MSEQAALVVPHLVHTNSSEFFHSSNATVTRLASDLFDSNLVTLVSTIVVVLAISALWVSKYQRFKDLPKGPWGYPFLGGPPFLRYAVPMSPSNAC